MEYFTGEFNVDLDGDDEKEKEDSVMVVVVMITNMGRKQISTHN